PVRLVADRQAGKGVTEDVDCIRGHVRSALRVIGAQGDADGDRGSGGVDELLQPLEVIWSDGDLFVVLRLLSLRGPERPPIEGIAAEPQCRRPQRRQLLVEVGIVRIEPGIREVGGFEGHSDVVCSETGAVLLRPNRDRGLFSGDRTGKRLDEFGRGRARFRGLVGRRRGTVRIGPRAPRQEEGERHDAALNAPLDIHCYTSAAFSSNQQLPTVAVRRPSAPPRNHLPPRRPTRSHGIVGAEIRRLKRGTTVPDSSSHSLIPLRGGLGLSVAMGMGRFFYTPALPLMVAALSWGAGPGSWIATLDYIGYFIGSLVVARGWVEPNRAVYRLSLIV